MRRREVTERKDVHDGGGKGFLWEVVCEGGEKREVDVVTTEA